MRGLSSALQEVDLPESVLPRDVADDLFFSPVDLTSIISVTRQHHSENGRGTQCMRALEAGALIGWSTHMEIAIPATQCDHLIVFSMCIYQAGNSLSLTAVRIWNALLGVEQDNKDFGTRNPCIAESVTASSFFYCGCLTPLHTLILGSCVDQVAEVERESLIPRDGCRACGKQGD